MLAKSWKKILLIILIIACLWNIFSKIVRASALKTVIDSFKEKQEQHTNQISENKIN